MAIAPTTTQIQAHVGRLRRSPKWAGELPIGIRSAARWTGPDSFVVDGRAYEIAWCTGPLDVRDRLCQHEPVAAGVTAAATPSPAVTASPSRQSSAAAAAGLVVVTPLDEHELGADVLARLARGRLDTIRAWDIVREQFKAHEIDPQVTASGWMADELLAAVAGDNGGGGQETVPAGVLDAQTAWRVLLSRRLGFAQSPPDLDGLLAWTLDADGLSRYAAIRDEFRTGLRQYLGTTCGPAAVAVLDCVDAGHGPDAAPLGLAARTVFHPDASGSPEAAAAAVRLEKFTLAHPLSPAAAVQWAAAAESVLRGLQRGPAGGTNAAPAARGLLARAEQIVADLKATPLAHLSDVLPDGYEQRLDRFGRRLAEWLGSRSGQARTAIDAAAASVAAHDQARPQAGRLRRVEMAVRLVRYLERQPSARPAPTDPSPFENLALGYARDGGFADWARGVLAGEGQAGLANAFGRLSAAVTEARESQNEGFARSLAAWSAAASPAREVLPIEEVLGTVVAPLAGASGGGGPVLVVVLDGMSLAVYRELLDDLVGRHGWVQLRPDGWASADRPVLATIPSATTCSRASLLTGRLTRGGQSVETEGFAAHPALTAASGTTGTPLLFHKADLSEAGGHDLSSELRRELASPRRVIGIVINSIDDYLKVAEQVQPRWTLEYLRVLGPLLHEAALAGRYVVLTSDHGHVLERDSRSAGTSELGSRWRTASPPARDGELEVSGPRVLEGNGRLICLWGEHVRYGNPSGGYHGGLTPQEMLVPLAVLSPPTAKPPAGWTEVASYAPEWWEAAPPTPPSPAATQVGGPTGVHVPPRTRPTRAEPPTLFDPKPEPPTTTAAAAAATPTGTVRPAGEGVAAIPTDGAGPAWLAALAGSPVYVAQKKMLARTSLPDATVAAAVSGLSARGGTMLRPALARHLNVPPLRLPGVLAALRRLLNVDGVDVLAVDEASDSVTLDVGRLKLQFDLE